MSKKERNAKNTANLNAYMDGKGIPAEERDVLPFREETYRLTTIQDILDATNTQKLDGFLEDLKMILLGSYVARMECPGVKLDHIDWTDDGKRVVACDMPDGSVLRISHRDNPPTNREVLQRAKDHANWSADNRKGYTERANVTYAYRTGFFHALNLFKNNDQ